MAEPQAKSARRRPGGPPPAPPATGDPHGAPDPAEPGPPIEVRLNDYLLGDLGDARVDARLISAGEVPVSRAASGTASAGGAPG